MESHRVGRVVVIGGGHAGVEACRMAALMGAPTTLLTMNLSHIGLMSCNPSIGGVGKGHMVREIDALGGAMGRLADEAGIHFRILNASRGFAVRGPRAQADRWRYRQAARRLLESTPGLSLVEGVAAGLVWEKGTRGMRGVRLLDGSLLSCDAVVLTSGTFLRGRILIGEEAVEAGRADEPPSQELADQLRALGLPWRRLKTGTSPRIHRDSIDYTVLEVQRGDDPPRPFSFFGPGPRLPQVCCHITQTTDETQRLVREHLHRSALYGGHIEGVGPRYCPSIEDKYVKFPDKERHQIFVEPDGLDAEEVYLAGLSTSMPQEIQQRMVQSLPGFERARILRPGYAIEYDAFDPLQLQRDLSVRNLEGVWFAGQINGTTGYEEAAGQGLVAGVNAVRSLRDENPLVLGRDQAYIGVMIDDLVTRGTDEPYRMLTARAEHRLGLACELADVRLLELARGIGALEPGQADRVEARMERRQRLKQQCQETWVSASTPAGLIARDAGLTMASGLTLREVFQRQQITTAHADELLKELGDWGAPLEGWDPGLERDLMLFDARYEAYRLREARILEGQRHWDHVRLPGDFFAMDLQGVSHEVREKLLRHRPETLGQAARIPGITPAAVTLLQFLIEKRQQA